MIYRAAMDYAGVRRIRALKERVGRERGAGSEGFDVKLDPGGIRDVEFVAQALQLLHGGRIPQLRDRSAQRAIARLAEVKVLPAETAATLQHAYLFLRRVENRLQMEYVPGTADIRVGDRVVTSGIDGIYPKGFLIGQIESVQRGAGDYTNVVVRPAVELSALEAVLVVSPAHGARGEGQE